MRRWSELAERVAATTRTSEKTGLLAEYLRGLDAVELPIAAVFLTGRPFAEADQRSAGLGWSAISAAVATVSGLDRAALGAAYDRSSDLGIAVAEVLAEAAEKGTRPAPSADVAAAPSVDVVGAPNLADPATSADAPNPADGPTLAEVARAIGEIEAVSGPARKTAALARLLERCDPLTAKYVVKVISGDLRIGLREGLLEAAIARAFDRPLDAVKRAGMLVGDIGLLATLARAGALETATLGIFRPIKFMLASPAEDAAAILARLGPTVWVEDKYDGIRAQLHRQGAEVRIFSRDLHDVTSAFPEIVEAAEALTWDGILDGEILAYREATVLPFVALQARLGRKTPPSELLRDVPVIYVAFDVLALGAGGGAPIEPLLEAPLADRRARLIALGLPLVDDGRPFALSHLVSADSVEALEAAFAAARARRNEGLMVKDPTSIYSPGRRGLGWLKMKKALATIDCVVVGVEVGHGKRHGVLSDYTFAIRDTANDRLVTIGKAYSGLTDAEIAEMTRWFEDHTMSQHGRYRVVEPSVVVEVAFDVILRSTRHRSGFALRFPRIARLRPDKTAAEADTLDTVRRLYEELQLGAEHLVTANART